VTTRNEPLTGGNALFELRAAAGPAYQNLITDSFEKIVLYDVAVTAAKARPVNGGYEVEEAGTVGVDPFHLMIDGCATTT